MADVTLGKPTACVARQRKTVWGAFLLGLIMFVLLWIFNTPFRQVYVPNYEDIPALADGLLLAPGAHWTDWFTHGYLNFWNGYAEWPLNEHTTGFTRPAFQFLIYLAHFAFGRNWASYQLINSFAAAGMAAVAFLIAQRSLGLSVGQSALAAVLVVVSPPILESWLFGLAWAIEPLATLFVTAAFFAATARRDFLCLVLLFVALLTKETTVWAPAAAAITIVLQPKPGETLRHQAIAAAVMFLPIVLWLGLRFAFFGGIGGTYATAGYTPLANFLKLSLLKLRYLDQLFVFQSISVDEYSALLNRAIRIGTRLLVDALLCLWGLRVLRETVNHLRARYERYRPTVDAAFLVSLWAGIAIAFHFALPLIDEHYAISVAVFTWPAVVAEVDRRRNIFLRLGLAVCCIVSLTRASYISIDFLSRTEFQGNKHRLIETALRQMPKGIQQVFVVRADGLPDTNPNSVRLVLDVSAEIVRVIDINWNCTEPNQLVTFDHNTVDGVVNFTIMLPSCANFEFRWSSVRSTMIAGGHLYRSDTITYQLPEATYQLPEAHSIISYQGPDYYLGRTITVHVRPHGPARFIIEHGAPSGFAWFDTP
jgi:hypothetical protein